MSYRNNCRSDFEQVTDFLANGEEGHFVSNHDNGRTVEITNMCGGRYLCYDGGEVAKQTDDEAVAYGFLMNLLRKRRKTA